MDYELRIVGEGYYSRYHVKCTDGVIEEVQILSLDRFDAKHNTVLEKAILNSDQLTIYQLTYFLMTHLETMADEGLNYRLKIEDLD